ncbi:SDR family oxidoreductase [Paracoccus zhejiangensis]|uniref:2-deoxy-D-gluconate 3-dehydrogenase n=1 Tax=Paracoccus zhejiangensis TaxID=1077935 RepID=A0A2H5F4P5_9RHOB|nr:SDR family oxidoreductase [Paracoccus zhejiangensis]AUH66507.1 2-deoxy-D-gluconate 3-dehydrogenase [Paracoccus zhejiangensis]
MSRVVVVIGGSGGIGRAIAQGFAASGDSVLATGHAPVGATPGIEDRLLDVRDDAAVSDFFGQLSQLDVLVNAAGVIRRGGEEFTPAGFADVIDINLTGALRTSAAARSLLAATRGAIINIASMLSYFGSGVAPAYSASKGGIAQLTRSLAIAWAGDGIRVNALAPGWIATALTEALQDDPARSAALMARTPMNRWGRAEDLVGPALFLASPGAAFVTGAILPVDGGYSAA